MCIGNILMLFKKNFRWTNNFFYMSYKSPLKSFKVCNSVVFSEFTMFCKHQDYVVSEQFISPEGNSQNNRSSFTFHQNPGNNESAFCLYGFVYSWYFLKIESYNVIFCVWLTIPLLIYIKKNWKNKYLKKKTTCTRMLLAALFTIAKRWRWKSKCPSTGEWEDEMWYIHTMEH